MPTWRPMTWALIAFCVLALGLIYQGAATGEIFIGGIFWALVLAVAALFWLLDWLLWRLAQSRKRR